jgi:hypothetical protein
MGRTKRTRKRRRLNERGLRDASATCVVTCRWAVAKGVAREGLEVAVFPGNVADCGLADSTHLLDLC